MADTTIVPTHNMDNIFGLENPETYQCIVWQYHISHGWLQIQLEKEQQRIYADFAMASYFEGIMRWQGARFKTASEEEFLGLLRNAGYDKQHVELHHKASRLYIIDTPNSQIRVIAAARVWLTTQWREYQQVVEDKLLERISTDIETGQPCIVSSKWHHGLKQEFQSKTLLSLILEQFENGYTQSDILTRFTWLEPEDIQAALVYARRAISKPSDT
jgi:hypothetical protein